jgi:hypothetical protein
MGHVMILVFFVNLVSFCLMSVWTFSKVSNLYYGIGCFAHFINGTIENKTSIPTTLPWTSLSLLELF